MNLKGKKKRLSFDKGNDSKHGQNKESEEDKRQDKEENSANKRAEVTMK
jgi:hypothetical protein